MLGHAFSFGLITASILALAAVGFTMQFGVTNILNLAFGEVMGVAGFVALVLNNLGLNIWLAMLGAALVASALSVVLNRFVYVPFIKRGTRLFGMVIVTIAVGLVMENVILAVVGPNFFSYSIPPENPIAIGPFIFTPAQLAILGIAVVAMLLIHGLLHYTKLGRAMRAISTDASLARACGIRTDRVIDVTWAISGALCGIAGVTLFINTSSFTSATANEFLVVIVAAAILGGVGQPYGAMLGALTLGIVSEVSAAFMDPSYKNVIAFAILVVVLLVRPQGILAEIATQREVTT